jgi:hypothetical protein
MCPYMFPFFRLPAELRVKVYEEALSDARDSRISSFTTANYRSVLLVNKQMHQEFLAEWRKSINAVIDGIHTAWPRQDRPLFISPVNEVLGKTVLEIELPEFEDYYKAFRQQEGRDFFRYLTDHLSHFIIRPFRIAHCPIDYGNRYSCLYWMWSVSASDYTPSYSTPLTRHPTDGSVRSCIFDFKKLKLEWFKVQGDSLSTRAATLPVDSSGRSYNTIQR